MSVRNELSDFEIEEFFGSLQELLVSSINNEYLSFDSAEFMSRRFNGYERTLNVLTLRIQESAPLEEQLISDLHILLSLVSIQRQRCERLSFNSFLEEEQDVTIHTGVRVVSSGVGRPRLDVSDDILEGLHNRAGFTWAHIARNLGLSERTLRRRRQSSGLQNSETCYSNIDDRSLDQLVRNILDITPRIGFRLVQGSLRRRGVRVQRRRVLESLRRVDPVVTTLRASRSIVRRRYSVPCPNALW